MSQSSKQQTSENLHSPTLLPLGVPESVSEPRWLLRWFPLRSQGHIPDTTQARSKTSWLPTSPLLAGLPASWFQRQLLFRLHRPPPCWLPAQPFCATRGSGGESHLSHNSPRRHDRPARQPRFQKKWRPLLGICLRWLRRTASESFRTTLHRYLERLRDGTEAGWNGTEAGWTRLSILGASQGL